MVGEIKLLMWTKWQRFMFLIKTSDDGVAVGIESYWHDKRMSDDGVRGEADHEGMRKQSRFILLLFVQ